MEAPGGGKECLPLGAERVSPGSGAGGCGSRGQCGEDGECLWSSLTPAISLPTAHPLLTPPTLPTGLRDLPGLPRPPSCGTPLTRPRGRRLGGRGQSQTPHAGQSTKDEGDCDLHEVTWSRLNPRVGTGSPELFPLSGLPGLRPVVLQSRPSVLEQSPRVGED